MITFDQRWKIFVYGTLRTGEPNHYMLDHITPLRLTRTAPAYTLVSLGAFPAMLEGGTTAVVGEVYEVDEMTLVALDRLESHPRFYERKAIRLEDGEEVESYILPAEKAVGRPMGRGGDWCGYALRDLARRRS